MHFYAVLIFVVVDVQHEESFFFFELIDCVGVYREWAEGSTVLVHGGQSTSWKVFVVGGAKDEDSFVGMRTSDVLVGPSCSRSTEIVTCMRHDQCTYIIRCKSFFGSIDVLS